MLVVGGVDDNGMLFSRLEPYDSPGTGSVDHHGEDGHRESRSHRHAVDRWGRCSWLAVSLRSPRRSCPRPGQRKPWQSRPETWPPVDS